MNGSFYDLLKLLLAKVVPLKASLTTDTDKYGHTLTKKQAKADRSRQLPTYADQPTKKYLTSSFVGKYSGGGL